MAGREVLEEIKRAEKEAQALREKGVQEKERILREARLQAQRILEEAQKKASEERTRILEEAKKEALRERAAILEKAKKEADSLRNLPGSREFEKAVDVLLEELEKKIRSVGSP